MVEIISVNHEAVMTTLTKSLQRVREKPTHWLRLQEAGRCLRWLEDPRANEYFVKAIEHYPLREGNPASYKSLGSLYRLCGEHDEACQVFQIARDLYAPRVFKQNPEGLYVEHMILVSFLAGHNREAEDLLALLKNIDPDPDLLVYSVEKLAQARRTGEVAPAQEAVVEIASWIKRERANVWDVGGVMLWDGYEIAVKLFQKNS